MVSPERVGVAACHAPGTRCSARARRTEVKVDTRADASAGEVCNAASTSLCASCATGTVSKQGAASVPAIGDRKDSKLP